MAMFTLIDLSSQVMLTDRFTTEDGKKAGKVAARLTAKTGNKYQVRKIEDGDDNWPERERSRFASGDYKPLDAGLAECVRGYWPDSFAHVAQRDPTLIAYTKDDSKGRVDIQSIATVDAFCRLMAARSHNKYPHTPESAFYNHFMNYGNRHLEAITIASNPVQFATTAEDISVVYMNYSPSAEAVANSCMRYGDPREDDDSAFAEDEMAYDDYGNFIHPVSAYAAGDLAVAYMTVEEGLTRARVHVWPEKKLYSRVYAKGNGFHRALQALGYRKSAGYYGANNAGHTETMAGARIAMIRGISGYAIMPYIDEIGHVKPHDGYFRIANRDSNTYAAQFTSGISGYRIPKRITCPHCATEFPDDTGTKVYTTSGVQYWCDNCVEGDDVYDCYATRRAYEVAGNPYVISVEGHTVNEAYATEHLGMCEYFGAYTESVTYNVVTDDDGRTMRLSLKAASRLNVMTLGGMYYLPSAVTKYVRDINAPRVGSQRARKEHCDFAARTIYEYVPTMNIKHGDASVYLGVDGRWYHNRYKDHNPMHMPRVPAVGATPRRRAVALAHAPVIESFAHTYVAR